MQNIKSYLEEMKNDDWQFHNPYDESMSHCFFGTKEDYSCYLNLKNGRIEFWYLNKEWNIKPPEIYSYKELMFNTVSCDRCGEVQIKESDLITVNENEKYCENCIQSVLAM